LVLRSFRLANHRSFRDELLLIPVYSKDREVLPVAAIYGANASGKSNLLGGLRFMQSAVRDSFAAWKPDAGVPRQAYAFGSEDRPSVFVVELVLDDWNVREEWLYSYPESRKRVLFERDANGLRFGSKVEDRPKLELLGGLLRPNALFLSLAAQSPSVLVRPVWRWFTESLNFRVETNAPVNEEAFTDFLVANRADRDRTVDLVRVADLGISDLLVLDLKRHDGSVRHELLLAHGAAEVVLRLSDESAGTRSWLGLLPTVLNVLRTGGTLVIDEIDASLHPRLTAALVGLFRDAGANASDAQLLFATHDAGLLSPVLGGSYGAVPDVQAEEFVAAVLRGADGAA
jgi:uncharacterized protein